MQHFPSRMIFLGGWLKGGQIVKSNRLKKSCALCNQQVLITSGTLATETRLCWVKLTGELYCEEKAVLG